MINRPNSQRRNPPRYAVNHAGDVIDMSKFYGRENTRSQFGVGAGESPSRRSVQDPSLSQITRASPATLELLVTVEPILWSGIGWYQSMVDATRSEIFSPRPRTQRAIDDLMSSGHEIDRVFYRQIPWELGLYGRSFVEYVKNESKTKIIGYNTGDPKIMDFSREFSAHSVTDDSSRVITDGLGLPVGYVQRTNGIAFDPHHNQDQLFKRNVDMRYLTLRQLNPVTHGYGFAEILLSDANLKENVEQAATAQAFNAGFPKPIIEYGNNIIDPADDLKAAADAVGRDISNDRMDWVSHPYGLSLDFFKTEDIGQNTIEYLNYINTVFASVLGLPGFLLYQSGKDTGRMTMEALMDNMVMIFRAFQRRLEHEHLVADTLKYNKQPHLQVTARYGQLGLHELKILSAAFLRGFKSQTNEMKDQLMSDPEWKQRLEQISGIKDYDNVVGLERVA